MQPEWQRGVVMVLPQANTSHCLMSEGASYSHVCIAEETGSILLIACQEEVDICSEITLDVMEVADNCWL